VTRESLETRMSSRSAGELLEVLSLCSSAVWGQACDFAAASRGLTALRAVLVLFCADKRFTRMLCNNSRCMMLATPCDVHTQRSSRR